MDEGIGGWVATRAFLSGDRLALVDGLVQAVCDRRQWWTT